MSELEKGIAVNDAMRNRVLGLENEVQELRAQLSRLEGRAKELESELASAKAREIEHTKAVGESASVLLRERALIAGGLALGLAAPALWAGAVISALRRSPAPAEIPCYAPGSQVAPASSPSCSNQ